MLDLKGTTRGRALAIALASITGISPLGAQPMLAATPSGTTASLDHDLTEAQTEFDRLTTVSQQLEAEQQGILPQREALQRRARGETRLLYHLVQSQALAVQAGPEALLDHAARTSHVNRALRSTIHELEQTVTRAATLQVDRARNRAELAQAQERRDAIDAQHREVQQLANLNIGVTQAGLTPTNAPLGSTTVYGGALAETAPDAANFGDSAGRLLFPVAGRAEVRHARRDGADGPGLEVLAPVGTPVRAVFEGRVAFADRYGAYGRIVIIEHGDHHYTVSANLGSVSVHVGDEVRAGTVLGTVGDDGRGPMLYFEVRHGSETVDPSPWLGL